MGQNTTAPELIRSVRNKTIGIERALEAAGRLLNRAVRHIDPVDLRKQLEREGCDERTANHVGDQLDNFYAEATRRLNELSEVAMTMGQVLVAAQGAIEMARRNDGRPVR